MLRRRAPLLVPRPPTFSSGVRRFKLVACLEEFSDNIETEATKLAAFLRWAGSKRKILPSLLKLVAAADATHYIEPFCGSAVLFFGSSFSRASLGDTNAWLISTYRQVRDNPEEVHARLSSMEQSREKYNNIRSVHFSEHTQLDQAVYFLYLNRYCFNGLFRTNRQGLFNVPFAPARTGPIPTLETLVRASEKLRCAELEISDFETLTKKALTKRSIVYLDPPYATKNRRIFRQYDSASFGTNDISRLSDLLDHIDRKKAKFILSYADVTEIDGIVQKWNCAEVRVARNIAGFGGDRKVASELLLTNF